MKKAKTCCWQVLILSIIIIKSAIIFFLEHMLIAHAVKMSSNQKGDAF